jgi:THO complex subunit 2
MEGISTFVGDFNRRYQQMDLEPYLQFIINRLSRGESADLTILGSILSVMSGVNPVLNFAVSEEQLRAFSTGREMIKESFYATPFAYVKAAMADQPLGKAKEATIDKAKVVTRSLPRLIHALRETRLMIPIWIALAQTRQGCTDRMASAPLKAMEIMQDNVSRTSKRAYDSVTTFLFSTAIC